MNFSTLIVLTSILTLIPNCYAFFNNKNSLVKEIDASTFDRDVIKNEKVVIVKFYAPYCGHCKKMIPAYEKLAENLKNLVDVLAIDCTADRNQGTCARYNVEGYPTIKLFVINVKDEGKGKGKKIVLDYNSGRSTAEMTNFIKKHAHQFIFKVSDKMKTKLKAIVSKWDVDIDAFFAKGGALPKLLLFRPKPNEKPTLLFRALSIKYHYKLVIGEFSISPGRDAELAESFNLIEGKGGLVYFPTGNRENFIVYDGEITRQAIFKFLNKQLAITTSFDKSDL